VQVTVFEKSMYGYPIVTIRDDNGNHINTVKKEYWDLIETYGFNNAAEVAAFLASCHNNYENALKHCCWIIHYFPNVNCWIDGSLEDRLKKRKRD
jgi:hypothetical protein